MNSYSSKCKKDTENINPIVSNTSNGKIMLLSKYTKWRSKKLIVSLIMKLNKIYN